MEQQAAPVKTLAEDLLTFLARGCYIETNNPDGYIMQRDSGRWVAYSKVPNTTALYDQVDCSDDFTDVLRTLMERAK
jgi:hypothetical protein